MHRSLKKELHFAQSCDLKDSLWTSYPIHKQLCIPKAVALYISHCKN